jgi:hypothetical protein
MPKQTVSVALQSQVPISPNDPPPPSPPIPPGPPGPDLPEAPVWDPPGPDAPLPGEDPDSSPVGDPPADPPIRMKAHEATGQRGLSGRNGAPETRMSLRALSGRGQADQHAGGATTMFKLGLRARYRLAKVQVVAWCVLAGLAGFFVPWLVLKTLH